MNSTHSNVIYHEPQNIPSTPSEQIIKIPASAETLSLTSPPPLLNHIQTYNIDEPNTHPPEKTQTTPIQILPNNTQDQPKQLSKEQSNFLFNSQTSEKSEAFNQNKIARLKRQKETMLEGDDSEDIEMSPQSSLRKLYKRSNRNSRKAPVYQIEHQQPQKVIANQKTFHESEEYESDQQDSYQEIVRKKQLKSKSLDEFVLFPIPQTKMIRCLVMVTQNKFFAFENIFDLYLVQEKRHLLRAKKKRFRIYGCCEIYGKNKDENNRVAQIRSNFMRTQYKLIKRDREIQLSDQISSKPSSQGFSSDIIKVQPADNKEQSKFIEQQISYIDYQTNFLGLQQQQATLLKAQKHIPKTDRFSDLKAVYQNCEYQRLHKYTTRLAQKGQDGKLHLDFKDKTITNSSRNMILENELGDAGIMFAKFSEDIFILNVMYPFNLLQAFFLALCNLDRKPLVS